MVVCDSTFPVWRVAHRGDILDELISAAVQMTERFEALAAEIERMQRTLLEPERRVTFATQAAQIRYPQGKPHGLDPATLLIPRRTEDVGSDAWRTLNVVQLCGAPHNWSYVHRPFMWSGGRGRPSRAPVGSDCST